jgi:hypothetical protein
MTRRLLVFLLVLGGVARAAVVAVPGYAVHTIPTPDTVAGGVVQHDDAVFVGQGPSFTAGAQSVIRLDAGVATTIATGFNSLGGFDLDAASGTLYVVDNAGELAGATTGDTVYAIPNAATRTSAVTAKGQEVVPAGTIPAAMDVLVLPDGSLLVVDAAGPGSGRIVHVSGGSATDFITGLNYAGGLARASNGVFFVGDVSASFVDSIYRYSAAGMLLDTFVTNLPGEYAHVFDNDGNLLVSGEFSAGCMGRILAIPPGGGTPGERAHGFCFSADMHFDAARDELLALDFGVTEIAAICRDRDGDGVCDADDDCPGVADADQTDTDGDGVGDACDACTGVGLTQATVAIGKLANQLHDDKLGFTGVMTLPASPPLDPATTGVRVLLNDGAVLDAVIPGGDFDETTKTGWKVKKDTATYRNGADGIFGIDKVVIHTPAKTPGLVKFSVHGKTGHFSIDAGSLPLKATFVPGPAAGQCGERTFVDPPCKPNAKKGTLRCK